MRELFCSIIVWMVGRDKRDVCAKMSIYARFGAFADGVESENHIPLLDFEKLFPEIRDYHQMYYSRKINKKKVAEWPHQKCYQPRYRNLTKMVTND